MAWKSSTSWHLDPLPKPTGQDLDNYGLDIRTWGAAVDAGGFNLTNLAELHGAGATNILKFFTAAAERMRIDASGKVGIGRAPTFSAPLEIRLAADKNLLFQSYNGGVRINMVNDAGALSGPIELTGTGYVLYGVPTSAAGLGSGSIWRDAGAGNVLKMVP